MERPDSSGALGSPGAPRDASAHAPEASESAKLFSRAEASPRDASAHAPGASESAKPFSRAEASLRDASAHAPEASESGKLFSRAEASLGAPGEPSAPLGWYFSVVQTRYLR